MHTGNYCNIIAQPLFFRQIQTIRRKMAADNLVVESQRICLLNTAQHHLKKEPIPNVMRQHNQQLATIGDLILRSHHQALPRNPADHANPYQLLDRFARCWTADAKSPGIADFRIDWLPRLLVPRIRFDKVAHLLEYFLRIHSITPPERPSPSSVLCFAGTSLVVPCLLSSIGDVLHLNKDAGNAREPIEDFAGAPPGRMEVFLLFSVSYRAGRKPPEVTIRHCAGAATRQFGHVSNKNSLSHFYVITIYM